MDPARATFAKDDVDATLCCVSCLVNLEERCSWMSSVEETTRVNDPAPTVFFSLLGHNKVPRESNRVQRMKSFSALGGDLLVSDGSCRRYLSIQGVLGVAKVGIMSVDKVSVQDQIKEAKKGSHANLSRRRILFLNLASYLVCPGTSLSLCELLRESSLSSGTVVGRMEYVE